MWLTQEQIALLGFKHVGSDVLIDSNSIIFSPSSVSIGSKTRIDAGSILSPSSGFINIGEHVHIAAGAKLFGEGGIEIADFAGVSVNAVVLSASDDFLTGYFTNPTVPDEFRKITRRQVNIGKHAIVGAGAILLPGASLGFGACLGAASTLSKKAPNMSIWSGVPAKNIGLRHESKLHELQLLFDTKAFQRH